MQAWCFAADAHIIDCNLQMLANFRTAASIGMQTSNSETKAPCSCKPPGQLHWHCGVQPVIKEKTCSCWRPGSLGAAAPAPLAPAFASGGAHTLGAGGARHSE